MSRANVVYQRIRCCVAVAVAVVIGASSLTNVAGAEPVGRFGPKHPDIAIPKGPFVQPTGRTDDSVPGDARNPLVPTKHRGTSVPPDSNADALERLSSTPLDKSESTPSQPGGDGKRPMLKALDGPVDEVAEVLTNPDGSRVLRTHTQRTFYKDSTGRFAMIDVRLKLAADGSVVSTGDSVSYRFDKSGVTVEALKGQPLRFRPEGGEKVDPVLAKDGLSVTYPGVFGPDVDVKYTVSAGGLKEDVILKRPQGRTEFPFILDGAEVAPIARGADGRAVPAGTRSVSVGGKDAGLILAPPVAVDKAGAEVPAAVSKIALADRGRDGAGRQRLGLSADPGWLNGLAADAYPVVLDPIVGVSTPMAQWANLRWFWPWGTGATSVACTDPPGPCPRQLGAAQDGNIFREHLGFNLGGLWSVIDQNPGVSVASAKLTVASSQVPSPSRKWEAYDVRNDPDRVDDARWFGQRADRLHGPVQHRVAPPTGNGLDEVEHSDVRVPRRGKLDGLPRPWERFARCDLPESGAGFDGGVARW